MEFMKPIASASLPIGSDWLYEIKYDGFRCMILIDEDSCRLISKNGKDLTANFPEIAAACKSLKVKGSTVLDGELVVLNHKYGANFSLIQKRGRLRNAEKIEITQQERPASFIAFDILKADGKTCEKEPCAQRRKKLVAWFNKTKPSEHIQLIEQTNNAEEIQQIAFDNKAEGIIAKKARSNYIGGKGHRDWLKVKNWRTVHCFLTKWNRDNDYFSAAVHGGSTGIREIGKVKHGLDDDSFRALKQAFTTHGKEIGNEMMLPPAICAAVNTLDLYEGEIREANFAQIIQGGTPSEMTEKMMKRDLAMLPEQLDLSNPEKIFWPQQGYTKEDLVTYIRNISPYMLPFLKRKALTLIRYPDGVEGEFFFQKHLPPYVPESFSYMLNEEGEKRILFDELFPLVWFANHGAIEYHMPFEKAGKSTPIEIVFDLDPPNREHFHLAVKAALLIKELTDGLGLTAFVKTSGSKGLQIHIPIREGSLTYDETAICTQAIALTVERAQPDLFTTERLKKKRSGRLYLDYVQHASGKTIIAPYSPRHVPEAAVATPLFWDEVDESLRIEQFTLDNVLARVEQYGCPFANYEKAGAEQDLEKLRRLIGAE
ncbi:DNA ligase D [Aciduricibacillus chroicocephali]|uniref:DNA ligase (ATP) n=1 Tax=Aciduricibacillus chroicocephali TaxID=3054939 RepID=A0ABY9KUZ2_9BACI|nr:DNA ligase D [Bacillaceae bacterium 44XB]